MELFHFLVFTLYHFRIISPGLLFPNGSFISSFFSLQYLDIPFLRLKHKSLREQLAVVEEDLGDCSANLQESIEASKYEEYLKKHHARLR